MRMSDRRELTHSLGFKPAVAVAAALVLGAALSNVDVGPSSVLAPFTFKGTASDARQLLTVVTGTMITVTSLVFGLTVVLLQVAATTYSPRLLRSFLRDRGTQIVLSTFVATVAYSMAGLETVGSLRHGVPFVPRLAVTGALVLALLSIGMLVYYIGHMTNSIRIDTIMRMAETSTRDVLHREHPLLRAGEDPDLEVALPVPPEAVVVTSVTDGYVAAIDVDALLALATRSRVRIQLLQLLGYHVIAGARLAVVWADAGATVTHGTVAAVRESVRIEPERKVELDLGSGIRQLVDIGCRAMGTTQNDSYTAVVAVHHLTDVMADAAHRRFATTVRRDTDGEIRVVAPVVGYQTHLKVVCSHIRHGGLERHPRVMLELVRMLGTLAFSTEDPGRRAAIARELDLVEAFARRNLAEAADLAEIGQAVDLARAELVVPERQRAVLAQAAAEVTIDSAVADEA